MAWIREGDPPEVIKVSFVVSSKEHPELAQFIWSIQHGGVSKILRDILSSAVKSAGVSAGAKQVASGQPGPVPAVINPSPQGMEQPMSAGQKSAGKADVNVVSAATADIIENFDRMFPSRSTNE